jgi:hypothetical protein
VVADGDVSTDAGAVFVLELEVSVPLDVTA